MAVTKMENVVNPEVMGVMINAKVEALCKLTPYAKVDDSLVGVAGDTKTVPSWNYIGDAEDVAEGGEVGLTQMTASTRTFTVKKAMKCVGITQEAINSGLGNPIGQAETQLAKAIAGKVDSDLLVEAYKSKNIYDGTGAVIGYSPIVNAVTGFKDEEDDIEKVMFIHPEQEASLLNDSQFTSSDKFEKGVAVRGSIGKVAGCWVKKSKKVKKYTYVKDASGTITIVDDTTAETGTSKKLATIQPSCPDELKVGDKVSKKTFYQCPILKMEAENEESDLTEDELPAVTIFLKKDIQVDKEWFPKKQQTDVTACKYYGVAMTNEGKVILARFKAA